MGILAPSASICHFQITGSLPDDTTPDKMVEQLSNQGFKSIEQTSDELSIGWVTLDDPDCGVFSHPEVCRRDHHICFSLRQDRRRVPAALYKRQVAQFSEQFLESRPELKRVPKGEMEEIRDRSRSLLMARTLPSPAIYDVNWDTERNIVRFSSLNQKTIETFLGMFHQTFPTLRLNLYHPMARAEEILPAERQPALQKANRAQTDSAIEQIDANRWLGNEFLHWLLYRTLNSDSRYAVTRPGPLLEKEPFIAYLDDRLLLVGGGQDGLQKIVVAGPQDSYREVKAALLQGKLIEEATLHMQRDDESAWKMTLKAERFYFGSYRTPMIKPDSDPSDDPAAEAEAAFLTKIGAIEEGEQMFDSLLSGFLQIRLGDSWAEELQVMEKWLQES
ncbi:MAG TPA: recombination-associated protein RdgC [Geopsychrobacteraceae bacterium]|nr:recombination-associated protein RdgC [Geopsychrobacteraceae bacterium]